MSLRTRIRGFTAWVNLRLDTYDHLMNNVLMDLMTGTNMKYLLQSMTGRELKRLDSFDGLSDQQKITRVNWLVEELKKCKVIPPDIRVDSRLFAMRSADHVFELLWRLVCHDIWFVWERAEFLQHENPEVLSEVSFKWVPQPPPVKKKKTKTRKSLLSGFGASSIITDKIDEDEVDIESSYDPYPMSDYMKKFKGKKKDVKYPAPDDCIMDMVNKQLKTLFEGRKLHCVELDDLVDSRVLCALVNSFVPNMFTTEVMLNDRWTINSILRTTEKMLYMNSPFDSEDLVEAEPESVCAYFCTFFMLMYKFRQAKCIHDWVEKMKKDTNNKKHELDAYPMVVSNLQELARKKELKNDIEQIKSSMERVKTKFDLEFCARWVEHAHEVVKQWHKDMKKKMRLKFDTVVVPRNITVNDLCLSMVINLSLTGGNGFYLAEGKEILTETRKFIIKDKETGEYHDAITNRKKDNVRKLLNLPLRESVDINPDKYKKYEFYFEATSRNKTLKSNSKFVYQVFPSNYSTWEKIFIKAVRDNELETVERVCTFFKTIPAFINCKEPNSGNSPLHWGCRLGHYDVVECLLENSANIDLKNNYRQTPVFLAIEGLQKVVAHLLVEWGCDIHCKGPRNQTPFETIKNDEFRELLIEAYNHYSTKMPRVMEGDVKLLKELVDDHISQEREFNNLRSRCVNGSTLLHTASYFNQVDVMRALLNLGVEVNLRDYKGATPLHRARDTEAMKVLMDNGCHPSLEDSEGNTPLHVKCYGETDCESEMTAIDLLLTSGAKLTIRNNRGLMPIHCAAMQGRVDVILQLTQADKDGLISKALSAEKGSKPPSVVHLAVANDCTDCAEWLLDNGFDFKAKEKDLLIQRILSEQIKLKYRQEAVKFLLDHGANPNPAYPGGNSALHYAAAMSGSTDVLETLISYGSEVDACNDQGATAVFFACQCNNRYAASVLIDNGSNVRIKNLQGLTAFDFILDYDEWIECGYFTEEICARLKAYNLKHARDLIRAITKKVKTPHWMRDRLADSPYSASTRAPSTMAYSVMSLRSEGTSTGMILPPLQNNGMAQRAIMF